MRSRGVLNFPDISPSEWSIVNSSDCYFQSRSKFYFLWGIRGLCEKGHFSIECLKYPKFHKVSWPFTVIGVKTSRHSVLNQSASKLKPIASLYLVCSRAKDFKCFYFKISWVRCDNYLCSDWLSWFFCSWSFGTQSWGVLVSFKLFFLRSALVERSLLMSW